MADNFFSAISQSIRDEQEQQRKLKQLFAAALASKRAEAAFPSPEDQVKSRILDLARAVGTVPKPMGGYTAEEQRLGYPGKVEQAAQGREMDMLQHILPRSAASSEVPLLVFDQDSGTYKSQGTTPRGSVVRNDRPSVDTLRNESESRALGAAAGTPQSSTDREYDNNVQSLKVSLDNAFNMLAPDGQFQTTLLRTGVPFQPGAAMLTTELNNAADVLLRMRSGAAITPEEYTRLRSLLPETADAIKEALSNPGLVHQKLQRFRTEVDQVLSQRRNKLGQPLNMRGASTSIDNYDDLSQLSDEELMAIMNGQ